MNPIIKIVILCFFVAINLSAHSQNALVGIIYSQDTVHVAGATIQLKSTSQPTLVLKNTSAHSSGKYSFSDIPSGEYTLFVNNIGYKQYSRNIKFSLAKTITLNIRLIPDNIDIEEITISAPSSILIKGDTLEYDSKNYQVRDYADADELVAQIPGVMIDEDGNVSAHGENVTRIIVDGKEFFSSDPRIALKNLPADIIAKIQLIDEKSEQARFSGFDDGKRNKVINIVTKPDKKAGYFGKSAVSKGLGNVFSINSSTNKFDGDKKIAINVMANNINETNFAEQNKGGSRRGNNNTDRGLSDTYAAAINYNNTYLNSSLELSSDYYINSTQTKANTTSFIQYLTQKQADQTRNQFQISDVSNLEQTFSSRIKWNINTTNKIDFSPNIKYIREDRIFGTDFDTKKGETEMINKSDRSSDNKNTNLNLGGSLTYMHKMKKAGRTISLDLNGNKSNNEAHGLNLAVTEYYKNAVLNRIDTNNNTSNTLGYGSGINSKLAFTESINKNNRLQIHYNFRNTANYSDKETFEYLAETGQTGELKERLSNEFKNDFNYHNGGLSYTYLDHKAFRLQVGLQYQHGIRNNQRTIPYDISTIADFNSILPDVSSKYEITKNKVLELNYNTQTNTPNINQLQDFINNQNELRITNGNPNLNQEYAHKLRLQYKDINKKNGRSLTTNATFEFINDKIINSILLTDTSVYILEDIRLGAGGQYIVPVNADGAYSFRINNNYGIPLEKLKINLNLDSRFDITKELYEINEVLNINNSLGYAQSIGINSKFSKRYIFGLSYHINGRTTSYSLTQREKFHVINQRINTSMTLEPVKGIVFNSTLLLINNGGVGEYPDITTTIWNISLGKKLLRKNNAELAIKGFDLLDKSQNIRRRMTENNITNTTSNTLSRYFSLSFTYNLRTFKSSHPKNSGLKE